jgi:hypothetical protein
MILYARMTPASHFIVESMGKSRGSVQSKFNGSRASKRLR